LIHHQAARIRRPFVLDHFPANDDQMTGRPSAEGAAAMKPVTYDFDVITDAPAPLRRKPEPAEQPPQADADKERRAGQRLAAPPDQTEHGTIQAAE
jgi:hypothetical protein